MMVYSPPTQQIIDVDIPDISRPSGAEHESDYGVRYASDSPGRMLRDKRYERNAND
jgi:hypothetical protein